MLGNFDLDSDIKLLESRICILQMIAIFLVIIDCQYRWYTAHSPDTDKGKPINPQITIVFLTSLRGVNSLICLISCCMTYSLFDKQNT